MTTYYCGRCIKASTSPPAACTCGSFEFTTCRDCAWATGDVANQRSALTPRDAAAAKLYGSGHTYGCLGHCGERAPIIEGVFTAASKPIELPVKPVAVPDDEYPFPRNGAPDCDGNAFAALSALGAWVSAKYPQGV